MPTPDDPAHALYATGTDLDRIAEMYGIARHDAAPGDWVTVDYSGRIPERPVSDDELRERIRWRIEDDRRNRIIPGGISFTGIAAGIDFRYRDDEVDALPRAIHLARTIAIQDVEVHGTITPEPAPKSRWERLLGEPLL